MKELEELKLKDEALKIIFLHLSKENILDMYEILKGYKNRTNRCGKKGEDTLLARCMFAYGYHNTKEFEQVLGITKDNAMIEALSNQTNSIKVVNRLRNEFGIDDETFVKVIKEIDTETEWLEN